jgi:peptidyl-prolyl cis-trans isomerase B (cyclophilin B)
MLEYVDAGFYDGTIFHRVIKKFMIQGGGYDTKFAEKKTRAPIKNEADNGLKNKRGTIALARTGVVDSATSQFFVNTVDNTFLDHRSKDPSGYGYAVVGEVSKGMDVVDAIENTKVLCPSSGGVCNDARVPRGMNDVPEEAVIIKKAYRKGKAAHTEAPHTEAPHAENTAHK